MRKTNKLLAAALAILLAFSTMSLSLTAFAQGDSLADRIAAYSGDLSDEAGVALAADYKSASDAEKDAVGVENVLKMYQLARARVQATGGWFPNYPVNIPKLIGNPTEYAAEGRSALSADHGHYRGGRPQAEFFYRLYAGGG